MNGRNAINPSINANANPKHEPAKCSGNRQRVTLVSLYLQFLGRPSVTLPCNANHSRKGAERCDSGQNPESGMAITRARGLPAALLAAYTQSAMLSACR